MALGALLAWLLLSAPPPPPLEIPPCPECGPRLTVIKAPADSGAEHGAQVDLVYWVVGAGPAGSWIEGIEIEDDDCPGRKLLPDGDNGDGRLQPGEIWVYRCTYAVAAHREGEPDPIQLAIASAPGRDESGREILGRSNAPRLAILHPGPPPPPAPPPSPPEARLAIAKCVPGWTLPGRPLSYELRVTNEGARRAEAIREVRISDPDCPAPARRGVDTNETLDPGETWEYSCDFTPGAIDERTGQVALAAAEASGETATSQTAVSSRTGSPRVWLPETVDFERLVHGCYAFDGGPLRAPSEPGGAALRITAENPRLGMERNAALVFDSACEPRTVSGECQGSRHPGRVRLPEADDPDLCTPHSTYGGRGRGDGGRRGSEDRVNPYANASAMGNVLISAQSLVDADGDRLVDRPNDEGDFQMRLTLDFSEIATPPVAAVRLLGFTVIDNDDVGVEVMVERPDGARYILCELPATGNNGVLEVRFPGAVRNGAFLCGERPVTIGAEKIVLEPWTSKGLDNIVFARETAGLSCF